MARTVLSLLTISTFPGYRMGFQYIVLGGGDIVWRVYPMRIGMHASAYKFIMANGLSEGMGADGKNC